MLTLKLDGVASDLTLPKLYRDKVLDGAGDGVRFLFDLDYDWCWPGTVPVNGSVIKDISEHADGGWVKTGNGDVSFSGNGFDWSAITTIAHYLSIPAAVAADLFANQRYLACVYVKLPTKAAILALSHIAPILTWMNGTSFSGEADLFTMAMALQSGTSARLRIVRQYNNSGGLVQADITPDDAMWGTVVQLAHYRTAAGAVFRLKSPLGTLISGTADTQQNNTFDFSAKVGKAGIGPSFWANGDSSAQRSWRLYRGFIENLQRSGRDPLAVIDADYTRTFGRGVFS